MHIRDHIADAISEPHLLRLGPRAYALRFESMKVASARAALRAKLRAGTVRRGGTVIDSSSGIYALALALACHEEGVNCRIIGSTTIEETLRVQLLALGVHLEQMPSCTSLKLDQDRRVARIRDIVAADPDIHWMRQYHDPVHYDGYRPIAACAADALRRDGVRSVRLVGAVGTGVSTGSFRLGLEDAGLDVELVGIQPFGSVTFGAEHVDDRDMLIAGIGSSIEFQNVRHHLYDIVHWVSYDVARAGTLDLLGSSGVFAGLSSGAGQAAARWECAHSTDDRATLQIFPDTGHRYASALSTYDGPPLRCYSPTCIESTAGLRLPWSRSHV